MPTARRLRDLVVTNWPIKITALVLATVLWAAVSAEAPIEQYVPVTLVVALPEGRTFKEPLPGVDALYTGAARELMQLFATPPVIRARIPDTLTGSAYIIELSTSDLLVLDDVDAKPQDVVPRQLRVQLDDLLQKWVRVAPQVRLEPDSGYGQIGLTRVVPESVLVRGPDVLVRDITSVSTVPSVRRRLSGPVRFAVPVDTTGFGVLAVSPGTVEVHANIVPVVERLLLGVPVSITGGNSQWESSPPVVVVTIQGPGELVARLTRDSVRVTASPSGSGAAEVVRLEVTAPPGIRSQASPDTAIVRRRADG